MQKKMLDKAGKTATKGMPKLMKFAVGNDQGYNALITTIRTINEDRKKNRRYIYNIDTKMTR